MNTDNQKSICETCGRPYVVDESADSHMNPPDNYRRGCRRYCLACWLGVGPKDCPDTRYTEIEGRSEETTQDRVDWENSGIADFRRTLKKRFMANDPEVWNDFLMRFETCDGNICYYPSAGSDFRPLVYQQLSGMAKLGLVNESAEILGASSDLFEYSNYKAPDLWIFSDFRGDDLSRWMETKVVHRDERVEIRLLAHTELHPQKMEFRRRPNPSYASLPPSELTGRVFYLRLSVTNETIGTVACDLLYFCVENVELIRGSLLRGHVPLSHVVWVRDGASFGGGRLRHDFLIPLLPFFKTRWLFLEGRYLENGRAVKWPRELDFWKRRLGGQTPDLNPLGSFQSGTDQVTFCEVESTRVIEAMESEQWKLIERQREKELNKPAPSVYLWLCCEGWMRFGPFEWLRYDEPTSTISDSSGNVIAWKERARWFVPSECGSNMAFDESYMITTTPKHPDPSNRNLPDIRPMTTH
jgi:hypothetical protein